MLALVGSPFPRLCLEKRLHLLECYLYTRGGGTFGERKRKEYCGLIRQDMTCYISASSHYPSFWRSGRFFSFKQTRVMKSLLGLLKKRSVWTHIWDPNSFWAFFQLSLPSIGMDTLNNAIENLMTSASKEDWLSVNMNVADATVTVISEKVRRMNT